MLLFYVTDCQDILNEPSGVLEPPQTYGFPDSGYTYGKNCLWMIQVHRIICEKTDLKVFFVVIPKEGWARVAAPIPLLV